MRVVVHLDNGAKRVYENAVEASFEFDVKLLKVLVDDNNIHWYNNDRIMLVEVFEPSGIKNVNNDNR